ncbi:MAG: DUF523 domain-containing protein [Desulfatiglandales bacterium]
MTERTLYSIRPDKSSPPEDAPVLVSACLLGIRCRYDGGERGCPGLIRLISSVQVVPFCPEQLGGLSTPRPPANIVGGDGRDVLSGKARVLTEQGGDVTEAYRKGAQESLKLAHLYGAARALLKDRSPSCGLETPCCDSPTGSGKGVTAALFALSGIRTMDIRPEAEFPPPGLFEFLAP